MAKILFAWELGKGFGHIAPYLNFLQEVRRKHEVIFAARDVGNTEKIFGPSGLTILQAPIMMHNVPNVYRTQYSFAHLLHNVCFGEEASLLGLVKAWRHLYDSVKPDLVMFDHSPTALLAAKPYPWKRIISGSGFLIPPPGRPIPMMRYWQQYDQEKLKKEEGNLLARINRIQSVLKVPPLNAVDELYQCDQQFHLSFRELDHYPMRENAEYLGMFSPTGHGVEPAWFSGFPRRVFAYLHPFKKLEEFLQMLGQGNFSTLVYAPEVSGAVRKKYQSERLVFSNSPIDITKAAAQCNLAITNGTFGTTAAIMLLGKPVLTIPTNLERIMVARRVVDSGAGVAVRADKPETLKAAMTTLLRGEKHAAAARAFSDRYKHLNLNWQTTKMVGDVDRLLGSPGGRPGKDTKKKGKSRR